MGALPPVFMEFVGLTAGFKSATRQVISGLDEVGRKGTGLGAKVTKGGLISLAAVSTAVAGIAVTSVKAAGDYQFQMNRLVEAAGEHRDNLAMISKGVLQIAQDTGTSIQNEMSGMYIVESAGYHGAAALTVLKAAAQGAKIENADLGEVANAVTSELNSYHLPASQAAAVTSELVAAVGEGKTTFQQLAEALPNVSAAAQSAHIGIGEAAAAIATMTMHGTDAAKAGTYLRQVIGQLEGPSAKARAAMKALGIDANQLGLTLSSGSGHGLSDAIAMLERGITQHMTPAGLVAMDVFKKSKGTVSDYQKMLANVPPTLVTTFGALTEMTGGVKSMQGFLQLGGENLKIYQQNVKTVDAAAKGAGTTVTGWAATQKTFNVQADKWREALETTRIEIGLKLLPVATQMMSWLTKHKTLVVDIAVALGSLMAVYGVVAGAIKVVSMAMKVWTGIQWLLNAAMDANPIGIIIIVIAALVVGIILAYKHSATFRRIVQEAFILVSIAAERMWQWIKQAFHWVLDLFTVFPGQALRAVGNFGSMLWGWITNAWNWLYRGLLTSVRGTFTWFANLPSMIFNAIGDVGSWMGTIGNNIVVGIWNGIANMGSWLWNQLESWAKSMIPGPIAKALGIFSPSRVMADQVGHWIPAGIAQGIDKNSGVVGRSMNNIAATVSKFNASANVGGLGGTFGANGAQAVSVVNVTVQGNVMTEKNLLDTIQQQQLRQGMRRGGAHTYQQFSKR